eukprot:symbB.v1.2.013625.t2/scaffold968.1/size148170/20
MGSFRPFELLWKRSVASSASLLSFAVADGLPLGGMGRTAPTGVKVRLPGTSDIEKSYSPVSHPAQAGSFELLVKAYPPRTGGGLGAYLCGLEPGETALMKVKPAQFSDLAGKPLRPGRWEQLGLVACGTGLAPLLQAREVLAWNDGTRVSMVLAFRSEEEILMRAELEEMGQNPPVDLHLQLSAPSAGWPSKQPLYKSLSPEEDQVGKLLRHRGYTSLAHVERAVTPALNDWQRQPKLATGVLTRLRKAKKALTAWQVLQVMQGGRVETNVIHYSSVIIACESQGAWEMAIDLLQCMEMAFVEQDVVSLSSAIAACEKDGRWECALSVFETMMMSSVPPNVVTYSSAISACEKKGKWQEALQLLKHMLLRTVSPNDITCNSAISACELEGVWQIALSILEAMTHLQVSRDIISYNSVLSTCESSGSWQLALHLLEDLQQIRLKPNIRSCNSVMSTFCKDRQWLHSWNLLDSMPKRYVKPDVTTCEFAIAACETSGTWQLVARILSCVCETSLADLDQQTSSSMVLVCGTDGFVDTVAGPIQRVKLPNGQKRKVQGPVGGFLAQLGYRAEQVHKF